MFVNSCFVPSTTGHSEGFQWSKTFSSLIFCLGLKEATLKSGAWGFPGGSLIKNPANAGDAGSIPDLGRFTCHRATKPMHHNCCACALEPRSHNCWSLRARSYWSLRAHNYWSLRAHSYWSLRIRSYWSLRARNYWNLHALKPPQWWAYTPHLEKGPHRNEDPAKPKIIDK